MPAVIRQSPDRRTQTRLMLPPCPHCGDVYRDVVVRTECVVYVRCAQCLDVWSVNKPEGDRVDVLTW
jgi:uncharacterized Zn finger protein